MAIKSKREMKGTVKKNGGMVCIVKKIKFYCNKLFYCNIKTLSNMKKLSVIFLFVLLLGKLCAAFYVPKNSLQQMNENQKIEKLLLFVEKSEATFIRNGSEHKATDAAKHLRMKLKKAGTRVKTARDFIDLIASKSSSSGEPYQMKFKSGAVLNTRDILYNELRKLEKL
jgi:hypothetical protein